MPTKLYKAGQMQNYVPTGNGARFVISICWKDWSGHAFNVENENGKIMYIDAQSNDNNVERYIQRLNAKKAFNY